MKTEKTDKINKAISCAGVAVLAFFFLRWVTGSGAGYSLPGKTAALASVVLAAAVYWRFVPEWINFWNKSSTDCCKEKTACDNNAAVLVKIFFSCAAVCVVTLIIIYGFRYTKGYSDTFYQSIQMWSETDANHYIDIARDWYLKEGEWDRLVQLVFLPGYPVVVKLLSFVVKDWYIAGIVISITAFSLAGCIFYKLMCLDYSHTDAIRAVKYMCIIPAAFFFAGPMSESLFLLLTVSCIYCLRTKRWFLGCALGGYAAFTRSIGITLLVPAVMEFVNKAVNTDKEEYKTGKFISDAASLLLIPSGFLIYCIINYMVSGDLFKFMEYQSVHWSQNLGWFFYTAAYQIELVASNWADNFKMVYGLWLPNVLAFFASLATVLSSAKKMRASYTGWFIAYFIVSMGATWLLSAPRYMAALMVLPAALFILTEDKKTDTKYTCCCLIFNIAYLYAFSMRWYVW